MVDKLKTISENIAKAASLLETIPNNNPAIDNVISETAYEIKRLEAYSATLVENIELTIKSNKV